MYLKKKSHRFCEFMKDDFPVIMIILLKLYQIFLLYFPLAIVVRLAVFGAICLCFVYMTILFSDIYLLACLEAELQQAMAAFKADRK